MNAETLKCSCCRDDIDFSQGAFYDADLGRQVCKPCAGNLVTAKSHLKMADMTKCGDEPNG